MASSVRWRQASVRAVAAAGSVCFVSTIRTNSLKGRKEDDSMTSTRDNVQNSVIKTGSAAVGQFRRILWNPVVSEMEGHLEFEEEKVSQEQQQLQPVSLKSRQYDFVVIGHGIAGRSAVQTLQELCPAASIAVVDPIIQQQHCHQRTKHTHTVDYIHARCEGFHPSSRHVQISTNDNTQNTTTIRYKHSALIATGSRGAPPPHYLFDDKALGRILELRPTMIPFQKVGHGRPVLDPVRAQQVATQAARKGEKVAVVGSGWDAVELAVTCSAAYAQSRKRKSSNGTIMVFGSKGPLSHVLPQYLSAAVAKRLSSDKHKIQIFHRSLIRYVGPDEVYTTKKDADSNKLRSKGLQLYTAKSYDLLDAARTDVNWLVVAPEVSGPLGTATMPTRGGPSYLESARDGRVWYQSWSQLSASNGENQNGNNLLASYADDGRIVVNAELKAGNGVYAAGSVAKYPNPWTGSADVAGVGEVDGTEAGLVAASNMARDLYQQQGFSQQGKMFGFGKGKYEALLNRINLKHPIPVWRTDQNGRSLGLNKDGLKEAGVYALCVGTCDSERFSTQAFWWTNQSRRLKQWFNEDPQTTTATTSTVPPDRATARRRRTRRFNSSPTSSLKPVYGRGIVYYMDQDSGHIHGVMIWGLPFTENDSKDTLNSTLVKKMQEVIRTNGGFRNLGQDSEIERVQFVEYLTQSSRQLVVESLSPFTADTIEPDDLPRPLIRYTEMRPTGMRRVRVLNRKQESQGHGFLGEDLFARSAADKVEIPPGKLPNFDSLRELDPSEIFFEPKFGKEVSREDRTAARRARAEALQNWIVWDWYQSRWEENEEIARPPKEEQLWLRKGDESRGVSSKDRFNESMMKAIFPGGR